MPESKAMNIESLREYCLSKTGVSEDMPFGETVLVFRVMGKIFLLASLDTLVLEINLKCDPGKAIELRGEYSCVIPGYHMNKKHWNTVVIDGSVKDVLIREWVDHSYDQVAAGLPKRVRDELKLLK